MGDKSSANPTLTDPTQSVAEGKGKGKAEPQDVSMGEEDSSSDEETGAEDDAPEARMFYSNYLQSHVARISVRLTLRHGTAEEDDEDNMEEIDTDNIVSSRTRGKSIDWNKAAEENKDDLDDDDDDDDEDFEAKDEDMGD
ncbi:MAG: hypothetical protein Q9164_005394 [Protoblastenia rupestris]